MNNEKNIFFGNKPGKKKNEKGQLIVKNQIWDSSYFRELHKGLYS